MPTSPCIHTGVYVGCPVQGEVVLLPLPGVPGPVVKDGTKIVPTLADNGRPSAAPTLPSTGGSYGLELRRGPWSWASGVVSAGELQTEKGLVGSRARLPCSSPTRPVCPLEVLPACPTLQAFR